MVGSIRTENGERVTCDQPNEIFFEQTAENEISS